MSDDRQRAVLVTPDGIRVVVLYDMNDLDRWSINVAHVVKA